MWNDESVTFGFDTKPKVERLGFLSQSESFGYGNNSQMSFLNDDTDNIIQNGNKQDDFLNELDPFSPQPFDNEITVNIRGPEVSTDHTYLCSLRWIRRRSQTTLTRQGR